MSDEKNAAEPSGASGGYAAWACNRCGRACAPVVSIPEDCEGWPAGMACSRCLVGEMVPKSFAEPPAASDGSVPVAWKLIENCSGKVLRRSRNAALVAGWRRVIGATVFPVYAIRYDGDGSGDE
jgi:hypothetical protein